MSSIFGKSLKSFFFYSSLHFQFFFGELTESTQSNLSWLSNLGNLRGGGGANFLASISLVFIFFFFVVPSSLFSLPPLSLLSYFLHLHLLLHHTISSLENPFPKLLSLLSFFSLNIFSDLCVLGHLCHKPIFWNPSPNLHFFCIVNDIFQWAFLSYF